MDPSQASDSVKYNPNLKQYLIDNLNPYEQIDDAYEATTLVTIYREMQEEFVMTCIYNDYAEGLDSASARKTYDVNVSISFNALCIPKQNDAIVASIGKRLNTTTQHEPTNPA